VKKVFISIICFSSIAVLVGCSSLGSLSSGTSGSKTSSQISSSGNQANNGSRVTPARLPNDRNDPKKTDAELVAEAIKWGDCAFLYEYTQKTDADRQLVTQANNAIKRYTSPDNGVGKYRNGKMEARVSRVPQDLTDKVFTDPETTLPGVVSLLTNGISDQFLKAKTLHDWICDNIAYDSKMYFSGRVTAPDYISVLKKKLAVCSGYANLFNQMCKLAGIESIGINGYSKGFGYTGKIGNNTDHAWNAVNIGNKWYLIDVTWDAGALDQRTYVKGYSTEWLFLDSRPFLYSHLPDEDAYQYYAPALTANDFMREPNIAGIFFQYGLSLKADKPEFNNVIDGTFAFDIGLANANVSVSAMLRTPRQQNIDAASWFNRKGAVVTAEFDVPDTNEYKGHIFARYNNEVRLQDRVDIATFEQGWLPQAEQLFKDTTLPRDKKITEAEFNLFRGAYFKVQENNLYYFAEDQFDTAKNNAMLKVHQLLELSTSYSENVLTFNIKVSSAYKGFGNGVLKYPYTFSAYNQVSNTQLLTPVKGVLESGTVELFSISSRDFTKVAIIINGEFTDIPKNNRSGNFELNFDIPPGLTELNIFGSRDGRNYTGLIKYNVK
jgi:transglutaminase-like putative cysteine protease